MKKIKKSSNNEYMCVFKRTISKNCTNVDKKMYMLFKPLIITSTSCQYKTVPGTVLLYSYDLCFVCPESEIQTCSCYHCLYSNRNVIPV